MFEVLRYIHISQHTWRVQVFASVKFSNCLLTFPLSLSLSHALHILVWAVGKSGKLWKHQLKFICMHRIKFKLTYPPVITFYFVIRELIFCRSYYPSYIWICVRRSYKCALWVHVDVAFLNFCQLKLFFRLQNN